MVAGDLLIKRVVATQGETVRLEHGTLIVNGRVEQLARTIKAIDVSWPPARDNETTPSVTVPRAHYFVLSDNRLQMLDSRGYGPLSTSAFVGIVVGTVSRASHPTDQSAFATR